MEPNIWVSAYALCVDQRICEWTFAPCNSTCLRNGNFGNLPATTPPVGNLPKPDFTGKWAGCLISHTSALSQVTVLKRRSGGDYARRLSSPPFSPSVRIVGPRTTRFEEMETR